MKAKLRMGNIERTRSAEIDFLIDSGSRFVVLPPSIASEIGLKPLTTLELTLADKRLVKTDLTVGLLCWRDREAPVFAAVLDSPEPLLGVEALEALGLAIDPTTTELRETRRHPNYLLTSILSPALS